MKKIILSALAIVAMASCSKENEAVMPNDGEVRICSSIATRTVGNTWEDDDAIGLYMTTNGGTFADLGNNVKYTTDEDDGNTLGVFTSTSPLYFPATGNVDLMAYYPYNAIDNISAYPVVNVTNQPEDQGSIDLMKAEASNVAKNSAAVNMTFKHKLARIKLNIKNGDGVTKDALANLAVTLKGTDTEATYDLTKADDASPITLRGVVEDIEMLTAAGTNPYVRSAEAIVIPQELNGATLTFKTSDNTYISTLETKAFTIGNEYIYNVTIKKTAVAISSPTIDTWGDGNSNEDKNLDALLPEPDLDIAFVDGTCTYEIYTAKGLKAFADIVNFGISDVGELATRGIDGTSVDRDKFANGKLMNNIDLFEICYDVDGTPGNGVSWIPIGYCPNQQSTTTNFYSGSFDGNGYEVSNLYINSGEFWMSGLFGYVKKDGDNTPEIKNLGVKGSITSSYSSKTAYVAGIAAYIENSSITQCYNKCNVTVECNVTGEKTILSQCGGITGYSDNSSITECYNSDSGGIKSSLYAGGIVGEIVDQSSISGCYNRGSIRSNNVAGGIIGVKGTDDCTVKSCYSAASVGRNTNNDASQYGTGGVIGYCESGRRDNITHCYYDTNVVEDVDESNNFTWAKKAIGFKGETVDDKDEEYKGLTSVDMKGPNSYLIGKLEGCTSGIWEVRGDDDYPVLKWQPSIND